MSLVGVEIDGRTVRWHSDQYFGDVNSEVHVLLKEPKFQALGVVDDDQVVIAGWIGDPDVFLQWVEEGHVKTCPEYDGEYTDIMVTIGNRLFLATPGGNLLEIASKVGFIGHNCDVAWSMHDAGIPMNSIYSILSCRIIKGYIRETWQV